MLSLLKDQTVYLDDVEYRVVSGSADQDTLLENKKTGERTAIKSHTLVTKYLTGEFKTAGQYKAALREPAARKPARMDHMSTAAKKETHRRINLLIRLQREGAFDGSRALLKEKLKAVVQELGESSVPNVSTIYRWRRKYKEAQSDVRALFARFDSRGGKGGTRLNPKVEALIDDAVDEIALKQRVFSCGQLHEEVLRKVSMANRNRAADDQLQVPSLRTLQRRAAMLAEYDLTIARSGLSEANRRFALHTNSRAVSRLLELVEIDHSPIDLMVVNADGKSTGNPTITVVLERATRCVLGYHLSLAGHGTPAVFEALQHALLPKAYLTSKYGDLNLSWPCFGWFERILMDNGREFHADAVVDALQNLGIACEFSKSYSPNDKPFVERFLRTLNYGLIHTLKGTTLAKAHKRVGFKPEHEAVLTIEELDRIIHVWICNRYHLRPHRGLDNRAPINVWHAMAKADPPQLKMNAADVDIEFSETTQSAVQHYGIDLNTFVYRSDRLLMLRRLMPQKTKVSVKWPRNNVGYIWVWDTTTEEFFKVGNTQQEYAGLTLEQAKAARKAKSDGDPSYTQTMAEAGAIIRGMVADADADDKLAKRRKGSRLANRTSKDARETTPAVEPDFADGWQDTTHRPHLPSTDDELEDIVVELPGL